MRIASDKVRPIPSARMSNLGRGIVNRRRAFSQKQRPAENRATLLACRRSVSMFGPTHGTAQTTVTVGFDRLTYRRPLSEGRAANLRRASCQISLFHLL